MDYFIGYKKATLPLFVIEVFTVRILLLSCLMRFLFSLRLASLFIQAPDTFILS